LKNYISVNINYRGKSFDKKIEEISKSSSPGF
jgi:hypothetical protein